MLQREKNRQAGFTLIELLVVLTIIAGLAALLIPSLNAYIQGSRQTRTVVTANSVGNGCNTWLLSLNGSALLSSPVECVADYPQQLDRATMEALLAPNFLKFIPEFDAWGNPWEYNFSGNLAGPNVLCLRSPGRNGVFETDSYTIGPFLATDYDQDIVWADGSLVSWPQP